MYRSLNNLLGHRLAAIDGEIGKVKDALFDDLQWCVRYLVASTGRWLPGRRVLLSPASLGCPDSAKDLIPVALTREQIKDAPGVSADLPVSRQEEAELVEYYGGPIYWGPPGAAFGIAATRLPPATRVPPARTAEKLGVVPKDAPGQTEEATGDPHLRSMNEVLGYHIQVQDGEIGHVEDFLVRNAEWAIRYVVADTRNWLPGRKVLLVPRWFSGVSWQESKVFVAQHRQAIQNSPEYDPTRPLEGEYEQQIRAYCDSLEIRAGDLPASDES